jgi:hypothetical protein
LDAAVTGGMTRRAHPALVQPLWDKLQRGERIVALAMGSSFIKKHAG